MHAFTMRDWYTPNDLTFALVWSRKLNPEPGESYYNHRIELTIFFPKRLRELRAPRLTVE